MNRKIMFVAVAVLLCSLLVCGCKNETQSESTVASEEISNTEIIEATVSIETENNTSAEDAVASVDTTKATETATVEENTTESENEQVEMEIANETEEIVPPEVAEDGLPWG